MLHSYLWHSSTCLCHCYSLLTWFLFMKFSVAMMTEFIAMPMTPKSKYELNLLTAHPLQIKQVLFTVKRWISLIFLALNTSKTVMLCLNLGDCLLTQTSTVKNLGATFDPALSCDSHITDIAYTFDFLRCNDKPIPTHVDKSFSCCWPFSPPF